MKTKIFLMLCWLMPFAMLVGCKTPAPVIIEKRVEVKVPVHTPCVVGEKPAEPSSLRDRFTAQEWESLTTDQRNALLLANGLDHKIYGSKLTGVTAGCD